MEKEETRTKVDEEEALTASRTRTTRTRTRTEATPTLIQGGTASPLEGSLVPPHARKRRPSKNKGPSVSMKVMMMATLRKKPFHENGAQIAEQGVRGDLSRGVLTGTLRWGPGPGVLGTYPTRGT